MVSSGPSTGVGLQGCHCCPHREEEGSLAPLLGEGQWSLLPREVGSHPLVPDLAPDLALDLVVGSVLVEGLALEAGSHPFPSEAVAAASSSVAPRSWL